MEVGAFEQIIVIGILLVVIGVPLAALVFAAVWIILKSRRRDSVDHTTNPEAHNNSEREPAS